MILARAADRWPHTVAARLPNVLAILALVAVSGCSNGLEMPDLGLDNRYVLSAEERSWHCGSLTNAIEARSTRIVTLQLTAKAESDAAAPTLSRLFARLSSASPGSDSPSARQAVEERRIADAYNEALRAKGCPAIDVDRKIATLTASASPLPPPPAAAPVVLPPSISGRVGTL
jgi:hypothetical protein